MSTPVVYGTELPIVITDDRSTIVFGTNSIHCNSSSIGTSTDGVELALDLSPSAYDAYAKLSEPVAELLASIKPEKLQFSANRTLRIGAGVAVFAARGEPFVQTFTSGGALRRTLGESILKDSVLVSSIPLLPEPLQKSAYSISDELLLTF